MSIQDLMAQEQKYVMQTYERLPVDFVRGQGTRLWDADGSEYIDFAAGIGVANVGHCHPTVVKAVTEQAGKLMHASNLYYTEPQVELARALIARAFAGKCFFANSGAEANEAAIKLVRKHAREAGGGSREARYEIITAQNSFHGRTLATLAATGQGGKHEAFKPLPAGFKHVPFNNLEALSEAIGPRTAGVMLEPIQGEGGVNVADEGYLMEVRRLCDERGLLLVLDEVQTGVGRTGTFFAYEQYGIEPDMVTLAKGLGGGLPIGALIVRTEVAAAFGKGDHGSTFGGNLVACRAALAVLQVIEDEGLLEKAGSQGAYLKAELLHLMDRQPLIREVRGRGLMLGIELVSEVAAQVVLGSLEDGIVLNKVSPSVLRLLPPLVVGRPEIDRLVSALEAVLSKRGGSQGGA